MTLIVSLGNRDQVIQISERRLTSKGKIVAEEANKAGVLSCANARVLYGFSGVARIGGFLTSHWLLRVLHDCGPADFTIGGMLNRLMERASDDFARIPELRRLSSQQKRLTVMFSGYGYFEDYPVLINSLLSNFQDFEAGRDEPEAWDHFRIASFNEGSPRSETPTLIQRIGAWQAMEHEDVAVLRSMLEERKPADAIVGKGVHVLREMAGRSAADRTIGRQVSSVTLLPDRSRMPTVGYHSESLRTEYSMPDLVVQMHADLRTAVGSMGFQLYASDSPTTLGVPVNLAIPRVGRNMPCPCGSGRKYKWCHGT